MADTDGHVKEAKVKVVVLDDFITYFEWDDQLRRYARHTLKTPVDRTTKRIFPGVDPVVEIPKSVYDKLERKKLTATGRDHGRPLVILADDYEAWSGEQIAKTDPVQRLSDEQLMAMSANELLAELNTTPGLAERVLPLEQARKYTRKPIVEHCERLTKVAGGETLEPLAEPEAPPAPFSSLTPSPD